MQNSSSPSTPSGPARAFYQTLTTNGFGGYFEVFMGDQGRRGWLQNLANGPVIQILAQRSLSGPDKLG